MRVSVVVASHNEGQRLWKTLESIVESCQGLDYELIVADDASIDDSISEAKARFPRVIFVQNEERKGASPTKALGARNARGEVLVFLDGHTKPEPGAVERLVKDVERTNGKAIITPQIVALDEETWQLGLSRRGTATRWTWRRSMSGGCR
jgi:glycosyltransferase involved in cell wall biosynthesis